MPSPHHLHYLLSDVKMKVLDTVSMETVRKKAGISTRLQDVANIFLPREVARELQVKEKDTTKAKNGLLFLFLITLR